MGVREATSAAAAVWASKDDDLGMSFGASLTTMTGCTRHAQRFASHDFSDRDSTHLKILLTMSDPIARTMLVCMESMEAAPQ
jgi:hypothetical protein